MYLFGIYYIKWIIHEIYPQSAGHGCISYLVTIEKLYLWAFKINNGVCFFFLSGLNRIEKVLSTVKVTSNGTIKSE